MPHGIMPSISPKVVHVAEEYSRLPNCNFSASCIVESNSILFKRMNFISQLLFCNFASNITPVRFVPAIEYGKDPANPSENRTVTGLLYNRKADISWMIFFTDKRAKRLKNLGPIVQTKYMFAFLKGRRINAELNIFEFFSWKPYSLILGVIFSFILVEKLLKRIFKLSENLQVFLVRIEPVFGLFTAIFLGVVSTNVVLLFNNPVTAKRPYKDFTDLATKIIEGKVRLASPYELYRSQYTDPVWLKKDYESLYEGLKTTFKSKPILNVSSTPREIVRLMEAFPKQSIVIVVSEHTTHVLKNRYCGLDFLPDNLKNFVYKGRNPNDVTYAIYSYGLYPGAVQGALQYQN